MIYIRNAQVARELFTALRPAEIALLKDMADGWCIISSQYERKTWLEKDGDRREFPKGVRKGARNINEITIFDLLDQHIDTPEVKTTDKFNHTRKYRRSGWRINPYTAIAVREA